MRSNKIRLRLATILLTLVVTGATCPVETDQKFKRRVLVLTYLPLDANDTVVDPTADLGELDTSQEAMRDLVNLEIDTAVDDIEEGSRYRGYDHPFGPEALDYIVVDEIEHVGPVPWKPLEGGTNFFDFGTVASQHDVCDWVDNHGVREIWVFKPVARSEYEHPEFMLVDRQDVLKPLSQIDPPLPLCQNSYWWMIHDFQRYDLFLHVWGHAVEASFRHLAADVSPFPDDEEMLWRFMGACDSEYSCYPATEDVVGRCGNVHQPPNARFEYDYANPTDHETDCSDWNAEGLGEVTQVSCKTWGCGNKTVEDNAGTNWIRWWMQNVPGRGNLKTFNGRKLRNWWQVFSHWDDVVSNNGGLTFDAAYGPLVFHPVTPCEAVPNTSLAFGVPTELTIDPDCGVPDSAVAVSGQLSIYRPAQPGWVAVYPPEIEYPGNVSIEGVAGESVRSAAVVRVDERRFNALSGAAVPSASQISIVVDGYFSHALAGGGHAFRLIEPCRSVNRVTLEEGPPQALDLAAGCREIGSEASGVAISAIVIDPAGAGELTVAETTSVAFPSATHHTRVADAALVPMIEGHLNVGIDGGGPMDLIVDASGYFVPAGTPGLSRRFYLGIPCRILDEAPIAAFSANPVQVRDLCNVPGDARGLVVRVALQNPTSNGYLSILPGDMAVEFPAPVSQLLFSAGDRVGSTIVVSLANAGPSDLQVLYGAPSGNQAELSLDVLGYVR